MNLDDIEKAELKREEAKRKIEAENKRNHEVNETRGMCISRLRSSSDWSYLEEVRRDLMKDLHNNLFMQASEGKTLYTEVTYAQIMAHRHGVIEGVKQFFSLLDSYESVYLQSKGEKHGK